MFEPISRETAVDACAGSIRAAILEGELTPGSRLPTERELTRRFGVNRATVRSALAKLASAKLLKVRQGSGYVVQDFRRDCGPDLLPGLVELARERGDLPQVVRDLLLMRRHMARAVLERVSESANARTAKRIRDAIDEFARVVESEGSTDAVAEADLGILAAILEATQSPVLGLCFNPIASVVAEIPELRDVIYRAPRENLAGWRVLEAFLATPDPAKIDLVVAELERRDTDTIKRLKRARRKG